MMRRVGGRRLRVDVTGGSSAEDAMRPGPVTTSWARSTQGLAAGVTGVVYCESAVAFKSQRLGAQTPRRTRHAVANLLACS